jgi:simple sugar transport system ATP-binding protein
VLVGGEAVPRGDVRAAIERGIGYVPQDRHAEGFAPNLSIEENLTLTLLTRLGRFGFVSPRARRRLAEQQMGSLEVVAAGPSQQVSELSGGNQQKVVVGRALLTTPRVLVVVSPTAGVDVAAKEALFVTLTSSPELAVLVVSDELDELSHCDRVLVMFDGRLTEEFGTWRERELVAAMEGVEER